MYTYTCTHSLSLILSLYFNLSSTPFLLPIFSFLACLLSDSSFSPTILQIEPCTNTCQWICVVLLFYLLPLMCVLSFSILNFGMGQSFLQPHKQCHCFQIMVLAQAKHLGNSSCHCSHMLTLWSKTRHIPGPGQEWLVCIHTHVRTPSLSSSPSTSIFPALLSSYLSFPSWPVSYLTLYSLPLSYPPTSLTSSSISLSLFFLIPHSTSPSSYLSPAFLYFPSLSFGATSKNIAF